MGKHFHPGRVTRTLRWVKRVWWWLFSERPGWLIAAGVALLMLAGAALAAVA